MAALRTRKRGPKRPGMRGRKRTAIRHEIRRRSGCSIRRAIHLAIRLFIGLAIRLRIGNAIHLHIGIAIRISIRQAIHRAIGASIHRQNRLLTGKRMRPTRRPKGQGFPEGPRRNCVTYEHGQRQARSARSYSSAASGPAQEETRTSHTQTRPS
jgi:hypothetical protein